MTDLRKLMVAFELGHITAREAQEELEIARYRLHGCVLPSKVRQERKRREEALRVAREIAVGLPKGGD